LGRRLLGRVAESLQAERLVPQEHLEDEEPQVQQRHQPHGDIGEQAHAVGYRYFIIVSCADSSARSATGASLRSPQR
jgi:hypothetical protein